MSKGPEKPLTEKMALEEEQQPKEMDSFIADEESNDPFQKVMLEAGNHGKYQIIYNIIFISGLSMCGSMLWMNIILALNIPEHWCTIPGRELTNFSLEEWRNMTLPKEVDNRGIAKYSSCKMFDTNFTEMTDWDAWQAAPEGNVTTCQNGWSYDTTWYKSTITTQENWVCDKDMYVTNVYVIIRIFEVIGSFCLGQMGDIFGRRLIYYISVIACSLGRMASILSTESYIWFLVWTSVNSLAINTLFQAPQIIGMEISREVDRSNIAMYQSFGWSIGSSVLPIVFWGLHDWKAFMWISSIPTALILLFNKYMIESPRWLISKGRYEEAIVQFKKIAKINKRKFDYTANDLAVMYKEIHQDKTYGMASLFSGWRLARNTMIMGFSWCVVAVSYFTLMLFSSLMGGNPFLNFLMQSIVEIPSYLLGKYCGDKFGRRATNTFCFMLSFISCIPLIIIAPMEEYKYALGYMCTFIKFLNAMTFFTASLQGMEIYPTLMRQTGIALGTILANAVGTLSPFFVYLGTNVDIRSPFYILGTLFFIGAIAASFLPETLYKKLPDTIEEARNFGRNDHYFSMPKKPRKTKAHTADESQKLNQKQYEP